MILKSQLGAFRQNILCSLHRRTSLINTRLPAVSFCFDDFPRTAYTVGGNVLQRLGINGTYYVALGLMNTTNELGEQFSPSDIDGLLSDGHELGCHTFTHCSSRRLPIDRFERDVLKGKDALQTMTGFDASNFAYPFGHVTLASKRRIGKQVNSSRGIYGGINSRFVDLNLLKANSLYGDIDQLSHVEPLLRKNERECGWLIFYTHDVSRNPSPFGCTPALLEKAIELTLTKGMRIAPVGEIVSLATNNHDEM